MLKSLLTVTHENHHEYFLIQSIDIYTGTFNIRLITGRGENNINNVLGGASEANPLVIYFAPMKWR